MSIIYYPSASVVLQRTTSGSSYREIVINTVPSSILFFDTSSQTSKALASNLNVTSSYSDLASFTITSSVGLFGNAASYFNPMTFTNTMSFASNNSTFANTVHIKNGLIVFWSQILA